MSIEVSDAKTTGPRSRWFPAIGSRPQCALRLFCFPYAGGTPSAFRDWPELLGNDIEFAPVLLPGRGLRINEEPYDEMESLIEVLVDAMEAHLDRPFAFFGHSMGALVAFEAAHELAARGRPEPLHLFVSGCRPPHLNTVRTHELSSSKLINVVKNLGSASDSKIAVIDIHERLPVLRADLSICERYQWNPRTPLSCPVTVFAGTEDPIVRARDVELWSEYTSGSFLKRILQGDHFSFLQGSERDPFLRLLRRELEQLIERSGGTSGAMG